MCNSVKNNVVIPHKYAISNSVLHYLKYFKAIQLLPLTMLFLINICDNVLHFGIKFLIEIYTFQIYLVLFYFVVRITCTLFKLCFTNILPHLPTTAIKLSNNCNLNTNGLKPYFILSFFILSLSSTLPFYSSLATYKKNDLFR